jgi:hypothetical protein
VVRNKTQQSQAEGQKSRQAVLDYLADVLTSPNNPMDGDQVREFTATLMYFPETREALELVGRRYDDKPDLYRTILLATAVECLNRLLA